MRRWLSRVVVVVALLLSAGAFSLVRWAEHGSEHQYREEPITRGAIAARVTAGGAVSALGTVQVGAQVSGRVVWIGADFNASVKTGEVIARLDDSVLRMQVKQTQAAHQLAAANLQKAAVTLRDAERQWKREQELHTQGLTAAATLEQAEVTLEIARANVAAARAQIAQAAASLEQAKTNLGYATITSPMDGVVLSRSVDVGQTVAASLQAPTLFTIAKDLSQMQIDTEIVETDVGHVSEGMTARFKVTAYPGASFEGKVRQLRNSPTSTQVVTGTPVVTYVAVIDVDNREGKLKPGMTAEVELLYEVRDVLRIPNAALRFKPRDRGAGTGGRNDPSKIDLSKSGPRSGGGDGRGGGAKYRAWKLVDGKPVGVSFKLGVSDGKLTEVSGNALHEGDKVIVGED
ncbi:MAG: efflux RND transporter periplasmic adaptor subunit [Kofleriaceae bacterium]